MSELREPASVRAERAAVIEYDAGPPEASFGTRLATAVKLDRGCVVVDLGDVDMVGSSTLEALHRAGARLRERHGRLAVVVGSEKLVRLLRLTLLSHGFDVFRTRAAAVRACVGCPPAVELELADGSLDDVGTLVVAGVASRAGLGVDRIGALQLAVEAVLRRPDAGGRTRLAMTPSDVDLRVDIGPLASRDAGRDLERVVSTLVHEVETRTAGQDVWLTLRLPTRPFATERR